MQDTTGRLRAIIEAFTATPGLAVPPAWGVLLNRVAPYADAAWDAAARGDYVVFQEALYEVYLAGLLDGTLPLGVLLAEAWEALKEVE